MLEVASPEPRKVREIALSLEGVQGVLLVGSGVHVHVDDAARRSPQLARALSGAGVQATHIEEVAPTIEDLFVALLEQHSEA
jgi:ABC-2 type transport system ATP-binding protein